jgi:CheY-like chemotaxis protein
MEKEKTVLIVDDDYFFSKDTLGYYLKRLGYKVLHAFTVEEFESQWQLADVILLDIRLPEKEGHQIDPWGGLKGLERIRNKNLSSGQAPFQLDHCIIRSAHTQADAAGAGVPPPRHSDWISPDLPFSRIVGAVKKVASNCPSRGDRR